MASALGTAQSLPCHSATAVELPCSFRLSFRGRTISGDSSGECRKHTRLWPYARITRTNCERDCARAFWMGGRLMMLCTEQVPEPRLLRSFRKESNLRLVNSRDTARNDDQRGPRLVA